MRSDLFPNLQQQLEKLGIADFEVYAERVESRRFEAKDGTIEAAQGAVEEGVALRVFQEGRLGFGYATDLSDAGLSYLCASVAAALPWVDPEPDLPALEAPPASVEPELRNFDAGLSAIPESRKRDLALAVEAAAKGFDPKVKHVRSAAYDERVLEIRLQNSAGLDRGFRRSRCQLSVMAVAEVAGDAEGGYEFDNSPFFDRLDPDRVGQEASRIAVSYLGATTPESRRCPVLLDPFLAGEILEVLAGSFQGDAVYKKRSFLEGKLGQQVYSPLLEIRDEGLLPEGEASCPFDGEGQDARNLVLVEQGRIAHFLLDRIYAKKLGLKPNASLVRRGLQRPPFISYANLLIPPGELSDEALFREVGSGILVTEAFGMHATNPVTGDFSVGIQGFLIEGGEKRGPVKKLALAGNLHRMMADLRAVGSRHRTAGRVGAPTLVIQEMAVGGA